MSRHAEGWLDPTQPPCIPFPASCALSTWSRSLTSRSTQLTPLSKLNPSTPSSRHTSRLHISAPPATHLHPRQRLLPALVGLGPRPASSSVSLGAPGRWCCPRPAHKRFSEVISSVMHYETGYRRDSAASSRGYTFNALILNLTALHCELVRKGRFCGVWMFCS